VIDKKLRSSREKHLIKNREGVQKAISVNLKFDCFRIMSERLS